MDTDRLLAEQAAFFRARAGQEDDWWEGRFEDDLGEPFRTAWRADAEQLRTSLAEFGPHGKVLELAAGTGVLTTELLRHGARVTAVDAAPEALVINRARHGDEHVSYIEADLFAWVPPRRFDAVCFAFWISHVPADRWAGFWALVDTG
jgi:2-polyprenyl-3-methyl-5-hydroxy-6-metoxy-1,4-benzoquinol methylase